MSRCQTLINEQLGAAQALVPEWHAFIESLRDRFTPEHHGDYLKWETAIEALPEQLMELHPWRKGPWRFDEVRIDTEWRSDWKWARVRDHVNLEGKSVLDVGCGNGYFGWQMLNAGAKFVVGVDPTLLFCMQHLAAVELLGNAPNFVLPARLEELPKGPAFDYVLSMGVLYHRKNPTEHLQELAALTRRGGHVIIETLIVEDRPSLKPEGRYARMRNVSVIPAITDLCRWMEDAGLSQISCVDITTTSTQEQRSTPWMHFESLREALDPQDQSKTVEGYPRPVRAVLIGRCG